MAKIVRVNHISFAVEKLNEAALSAEETLGGKIVARFEDNNGKYRGVGIQLGESLLSLLEPMDDSSFVAEFIRVNDFCSKAHNIANGSNYSACKLFNTIPYFS